MNSPITVAVTGLNATDNPGAGVPVIRALRESTRLPELRIVGLVYEHLEPGIYMHQLVDKSYTIPLPTLGTDTLLARLEYIHSREGIDVLIPNFDAELPNFIHLRERMQAMGIATLLPTIEQFEQREKERLPELARTLDIATPRTATATSLAELRRALAHTGYPAMIKGRFYEAYLARSYEEALSWFYKLTAKWGVPVIVQQYIQGIELNVTALGDGKGRLIGAVPSRKTYVTNLNKGWAGVAVKDEELMDLTRRIIEGLQWPGGMEVELLCDQRDGTRYLVELNPRFPAWVYFAVGCGQNHPEALVLLALGQEVEPFTHYDKDKMFVRYSWDMICPLEAFERISTTGEL